MGNSKSSSTLAILNRLRAMNGLPPYLSHDEILAIMERNRTEHRWRTDPLGLMPWLSLNEWRWRAADALEALARWVAPGDGY